MTSFSQQTNSSLCVYDIAASSYFNGTPDSLDKCPTLPITEQYVDPFIQTEHRFQLFIYDLSTDSVHKHAYTDNALFLSDCNEVSLFQRDALLHSEGKLLFAHCLLMFLQRGVPVSLYTNVYNEADRSCTGRHQQSARCYRRQPS